MKTVATILSLAFLTGCATTTSSSNDPQAISLAYEYAILCNDMANHTANPKSCDELLEFVLKAKERNDKAFYYKDEMQAARVDYIFKTLNSRAK